MNKMVRDRRTRSSVREHIVYVSHRRERFWTWSSKVNEVRYCAENREEEDLCNMKDAHRYNGCDVAKMGS